MSEPWVIWSFEHIAWWRPDRCGYTSHLDEAGHYSEQEARDIVDDANIAEVNETALRLSEARRRVSDVWAVHACAPWQV